MKLQEHERAVLTEDIPGEGLKAGDLGTIIHVHGDGIAYVLEFFSVEGDTVAIATAEASQVRPVERDEINHIRKMESAA
ncbi:MAG: DUF4926 domain-containing protein [SAR202 cluster bacterium]|nr:DUF4926 domain-containing protein [SAR202 cluster bacterium]